MTIAAHTACMAGPQTRAGVNLQLVIVHVSPHIPFCLQVEIFTHSIQKPSAPQTCLGETLGRP